MTDAPVSMLATPLPAGKSAKDMVADLIKKRENVDLLGEGPNFVSGVHGAAAGRLDIGFGYDVTSHSMVVKTGSESIFQ